VPTIKAVIARPLVTYKKVICSATDLQMIDTTSHPPRFYDAPNFLKMGVKMPRFVVFWTTSTIKDENSAAKLHDIKTVSG